MIRLKKYKDNKGRRVVEVWDLSYLDERDHGYTWLRLHLMHHKTGWNVRRADIVLVPDEKVAKDVVRFYMIPKEKVKIMGH